MTVKFRKLVVGLGLGVGMTLTILVALHAYRGALQPARASVQVACNGGGQRDGCGATGSIVRLGTVVVTPTPAEHRYAMSHGLAPVDPTSNVHGTASAVLDHSSAA